MLAHRGCPHRLRQRCLGLAHLARLKQQVTLDHQRLREHRRVGQLACGLGGDPRGLQARTVLAGPLERSRRVELHAHAVDRGPRLHVGGRHHGGGQRVLVGAAAQVVEAGDHLHRALEHRRVGAGEHGGDGSQLAEAAREAGVLEVEELDALGVVDVSRGAGRGLHAHPAVGVAVEGPGDALPGIFGEGAVTGGEEGGVGGLAGVVVPHAGEVLLGVGAALGRLGQVLRVADGGEGEQAEAGGHGEPALALVAGVTGEGVDELGDRRVAVGGVAAQALEQDLAQPRRHPGLRLARGLGHLAADHRHRQARHGVGRERRRAVERLIESDTEAELVGARVGRQAEVLLRRHVRWRPHHRALLGELAAERLHAAGQLEGAAFGLVRPLAALLGRLGESEVQDLRLTGGGHEHVLGLEVAVDQAGVVRGLQAAAGLDEHREHLLAGPRARAQPRLEGGALDELHGDEDAVAVGADVVHCDDVGVAQAGHRLGLAQQSGVAVDARLGRAAAGDGLAVQQLERDLAVELRVVGRVDHAHAAGTERVQDHVATDQLSVADLLGRAREGRAAAADRARHADLLRALAACAQDRGRLVDEGGVAGVHGGECTTLIHAPRRAPSRGVRVPLSGSTWPLRPVRSNMS